MASTSKLFREALINASNVSRLSHILLLLLTKFFFENSCSQMAILVGITSTHCHNDTNKGQLSHGRHKLHNAEVDWQKLEYTPYIPNYLSVLIGTQILRNLWQICNNAQLRPNKVGSHITKYLRCREKPTMRKC
jgi:hypothetical protein